MTLKSAHTGKIGKAFKNARTYRDLSLREVALKTLINIDYIKAIESGDYSKFLGFLASSCFSNSATTSAL